MVVPMRLAATMRLKLVGVGGADAAEAMCATSSCAVGTGRYAHTVGTRNSWAHVAAHHSSGVGYAEAPHVRVLLSAEPVAAGHRARVPSSCAWAPALRPTGPVWSTPYATTTVSSRSTAPSCLSLTATQDCSSRRSARASTMR